MTEQSAITVVVIAASKELARKVASLASLAGYSVKGKVATDLATFQAELKMREWDGILVAEQLPDGVGLKQLVELVKDCQAATPVFIVSQQPNETLRYEALLAGATDALSLQCPPLFRSLMEREAQLYDSLKQTETETVDPNLLSEEERVWYERIQQALEHDRFICVYQPIVNLKADPYPIYEVLIRMLDADGNEISPGAFLGSAEKAGFMKAIDRWVISNSIRSLQEKVKSEPQMRLFIKLSRCSIQDDALGAWISEQLYTAKLPKGCLAFEFTEEDVREHRAECSTLIKSLKLNHCKVVIDRVTKVDDHLEGVIMEGVDYIKISGEVMRHLNKDDRLRDTVIQIATRARRKEIKVIAQCVQDASVLTFLWQHGVSYMQGYYVQHPDTSLDYDFTQEGDGEEVVLA